MQNSKSVRYVGRDLFRRSSQDRINQIMPLHAGWVDAKHALLYLTLLPYLGQGQPSLICHIRLPPRPIRIEWIYPLVQICEEVIKSVIERENFSSLLRELIIGFS